MLVEEKFTVRAPVETVWGFLLDVDGLSVCVPGCESLEVVGDGVYRARVAQKVGFIGVKFDLILTITEIDPPRRLVSRLTGDDVGNAGALDGANTLELKALSPEETEVSYSSETRIVGRLATLGESVMRGKARKLAAQFASSVKGKLEEGK